VQGFLQGAVPSADVGPEDVEAFPADGFRRAEPGDAFGGRVEIGDLFFRIDRENSFVDTFDDRTAVGGRER